MDILTPEVVETQPFMNWELVDKANLNEGNTVLLNDGTGHFLQIMFMPFSQKGLFKKMAFFIQISGILLFIVTAVWAT